MGPARLRGWCGYRDALRLGVHGLTALTDGRCLRGARVTGGTHTRPVRRALCWLRSPDWLTHETGTALLGLVACRRDRHGALSAGSAHRTDGTHTRPAQHRRGGRPARVTGTAPARTGPWIGAALPRLLAARARDQHSTCSAGSAHGTDGAHTRPVRRLRGWRHARVTSTAPAGLTTLTRPTAPTRDRGSTPEAGGAHAQPAQRRSADSAYGTDGAQARPARHSRGWRRGRVTGTAAAGLAVPTGPTAHARPARLSRGWRRT